MDSKIILAIFIVALIGIVAATYQNETNDVIDTLSNVATEDSGVTTDVETPTGDSISINDNSGVIDESTVKLDTSTSSVTTQKQSTNSKPRTNTASSGSNKISSGQSTTTTNNTTTNNNKPTNNPLVNKISQSTAVNTGRAQLPAEYKDATYSITETSIDNNPYYYVNFYKNGEMVAYYEINANSGRVSGGAIVNETPTPSNSTNE